MMVKQTITIDGRPVEFRASAAIPRLYRIRFHRDILVDMQKLQQSFFAIQDGTAQFDVVDLEIFENVAFLMAKHADPDIPDTPEAWLDGFDVFSIYNIAPQVFALWADNSHTQVQPQKK